MASPASPTVSAPSKTSDTGVVKTVERDIVWIRTHILLLVFALAVVAASFIVWGLFSDRLERWNVSAPIASVVLGLMATHGPINLVHFELTSSTIRSLAEVTLALVLFTDASRVNARTLRTDVGLPTRLLAIGLPLTIGAGAAVAYGLFAGSGIWVAATIGAIVAPTDAALGASVMEDARVPSGVRRLLNIESGLNDGIAAPFVNLFIAGAASAEAVQGSSTVATAAVDLIGGAALGVGVGVTGAVLLSLTRRHGWSAPVTPTPAGDPGARHPGLLDVAPRRHQRVRRGLHGRNGLRHGRPAH